MHGFFRLRVTACAHSQHTQQFSLSALGAGKDACAVSSLRTPSWSLEGRLMPASRNPFFLRTAEQSESDDQFLNLFSRAVLDLLPEDGSWNRFLPIEGAPGSGKSTLLRLFTPTVLRSIENMRGQGGVRWSHPETHGDQRVRREWCAVARGSRELQGGLQSACRFRPEAPAHGALFRSLLHSRLALLTIRAALQLVGRAYPADVDIVRFEPRDDAVLGRQTYALSQVANCSSVRVCYGTTHR